MSSIWFTSDTHYHHKNIVRGTSEWENTDRCRKFDTLEEHDDILIQNINKVCKPQDVIYHNGDWSFGGVDKVSEFFNRLNCHNIHLILGNHDHHIAKKDTFEHNLFFKCE